MSEDKELSGLISLRASGGFQNSYTVYVAFEEHIDRRLEKRMDRITELEDRLFKLGAMEQAPCFCCGYNGKGYYQPSSHSCAERHHRVIGKSDV